MLFKFSIFSGTLDRLSTILQNKTRELTDDWMNTSLKEKIWGSNKSYAVSFSITIL